MTKRLYSVYPASWAWPAGVEKTDVTIETVTNIAPVLGGSVQTFFCDGDVYSEFGWMENLEQSVRLTIGDFSLLTGDDALAVGDVGVLTVQMPQRASGAGGLESGDATWLQAICGGPITGDSTQDNGCLISGISPAGNHSGASPMNLDFKMSAVDGTTSPVALSMENPPS